MARSYFSRGLDLWDENEWRYIVLFLAFWTALNAYAVWEAWDSGDWGLTTFGYDLLVAFIWATFLMGAFFLRIFRGEAIVPFRYLLRKMTLAALVFGVVLVIIFRVAMMLALFDDPEVDDLPVGVAMVTILIIVFIGGFLAGLLSLLLGYVMCMGLVGVIYLLSVGMVPPFMRRVRNLTGGDRWYGGVISWLFFIPDNLDTSTLHATMPVREEAFPWARFRRAVGWQVLFALLVAILVSLNPFLLDAVSLDTLFNIMDNAHIIVPMIFLPAMVFLRLQARIEAPIKDFQIYIGIRKRLVRTFLAIGTVVIFIRMAIKDLDPFMLLAHLFLYSIISITLIATFTFLYFNYFENRLAQKVVERAPWLVQDGEDGEVGNGDGQVPEPEPTGT